MLLMDTIHLGSARVFAKNHRKKNITVFGTAKNLPSKCKSFQVSCEPGWSSSVLNKVRKNRYGLIYLDFMCTPDGGTCDFDPLEDMMCASTLLNKNGILAVTFSKRCASVVSKCINICPPSLRLQRAFEYCDTSPMIFLVYSMRKLPPFGPPVGSLVHVKMGQLKRKYVGRVNKLYLDGVGLTEMVKKGKKYKKKKKQVVWDEPFSALQIIDIQ